MKEFLRRNRFIVAPLVAAVGLTACGGGGGGGGGASSSTVSITGVVAKGVSQGVTVTAYKLNSNGTKGALVGTGTTNSDGSYSITLDSGYTGGPLKIEVSHSTGATMKCDLPSGCGTGVSFGDEYALTSDFSMSAVTANLASSDKVNVTPITTVATKVLERKLSSFGDGDGTEVTSTRIAITNSEIANLFSISTGDGGDLTRIPVIDITDPTVTATASVAELKYAAIGPAIVEAVKNESGNTDSIEQALTRFADDNSDGSIKGETTAAGVTDLKEVFEATESVIDEADKLDEGIAIENKVGVVADLALDVSDAEEVGDNDKEGTASELSEITDDIAKAKVAMSQIRELGRVSFMDALDAENNNAGAATAFQTQLSAAEGAADSAYVMEATALAIDAIARVAEDDDDAHQIVIDDNGIVISVTESPAGTFTVNQSITIMEYDDIGNPVSKAVAVNITAIYSSTLTQNESESSDRLTYNSNLSGSISFTVTGSATSADTILTINQGSQGQGTLSAVEYEHDTDWHVAQEVGSDTGSARFDATLSGVNVRLDVTLTHSDSEKGNTSFNGDVTVSLDRAVLDIDETETLTHTSDGNGGSTDTRVDNENAIARLGLLSIGLEGTFAHGTDEFKAAFGLALNGHNRNVTNECEETEVQSWEMVDDNYYHDYSESGYCTNNLDTTLIDANIALGFNVDLNGIEDAARVLLIGQRDGLEGFDVDLSVKYPGVELSFDMDTENLNSDLKMGSLTVTNLDGVKFALTAEYDATKLDGQEDTVNNGTVSVITGDNEQFVGDLVHDDVSNILTAYFVDDSFDTLQ